MDSDNSETKTFASITSYFDFENRVRNKYRFATDIETRDFISVVLATASSRKVTIKQEQIFFRAQLGIDEYEYEGDDGNKYSQPAGHSRERMIPDRNKVLSGRANPEKIAFLYLASAVETAIAEVRPWLGNGVSVAQFKVKRNLRVLNLTQGAGSFGILSLTFDQLDNNTLIDPETMHKAVWTDIDNAFSEPVSRSDDPLAYIPTQILTEAFREAGYDGLVYRSQFGDPGYNIVLFDPSDAEILNCAPFEIKKIKIEYQRCGDPWVCKK